MVGFRDGRLLSVPLGDTAGIRPGDRIVAVAQGNNVFVDARGVASTGTVVRVDVAAGKVPLLAAGQSDRIKIRVNDEEHDVALAAGQFDRAGAVLGNLAMTYTSLGQYARARRVGPGADVLAARANELALSLRRRYAGGERFTGTLARAPVGGGTPRELLEG